MKTNLKETRNTLLEMGVEAVILETALSGPVADSLAKWLAAQYAVVAREQLDSVRHPFDADEKAMWQEEFNPDLRTTKSDSIRPNPAKSDHERN
ncbi:MAG: hypothetical protein ACREIF_16625 [Chthoniobacterales bacterium]